MKKIVFLLCLLILPAQAFEDCVISTDGKLTDISIEQNDIIDVYPIFTIMNEKNTLFVHPLKAGKTRFCVLKTGNRKLCLMWKLRTKQLQSVRLMVLKSSGLISRRKLRKRSL